MENLKVVYHSASEKSISKFSAFPIYSVEVQHDDRGTKGVSWAQNFTVTTAGVMVEFLQNHVVLVRLPPLHNCITGFLYKLINAVMYNTVNSCYLSVGVHCKLQISQSKFSGPRKFL